MRMKVSGCVANIIRITQVTCKCINNVMLTYITRLNFFRLEILLHVLLTKIGCEVTVILHVTLIAPMLCSPTTEASIFCRLDYPIGLLNFTILNMLTKHITTKPEVKTDDGNTIVVPFKDLIAANAARRQLRDISSKIAVTSQPTIVSKKLEQNLKPK